MHEPILGTTWKKYPTGIVTQWFGENPALYQRWGLKYHNGIDLVANYGTPLRAVEDGVVVGVKLSDDGFGKHLRLRSTTLVNGEYRCWTYGHCSKITVKNGDRVKAGDKVAEMGNSGFVVSGGQAWWGGENPDGRGTHLHLGLRILIPDRRGWSYPGDDKTYIVKDYDNGVKGAIDPLPYFTEPNIPLMKQVVVLLQRLLLLKKRAS